MRPTLLVSLAAAVVGLAIGIGGYTFGYSRAYSYATSDPAACANCHAMSRYYAGWIGGPHHAAAVCVDCHTPHERTGKYATKATDGVRHSFYFTTGRYPDTPQITARNREIVEGACRHCHGDIVQAIDRRPGHARGETISCLRCHPDVGHM